MEQLAALNERGELPDLSIVPGFVHQDDAAISMKDSRRNSMILINQRKAGRIAEDAKEGMPPQNLE